jgi:hypothetical protein
MGRTTSTGIKDTSPLGEVNPKGVLKKQPFNRPAKGGYAKSAEENILFFYFQTLQFE